MALGSASTMSTCLASAHRLALARMADDMTTPNGNFDPIAQWARLSERVENQGKDIIDLRSNMNTGFQNIQSALAGLSNELRGSQRTQWPVIWSAAAVCVSILGGLGFVLLQPVKDNVAEAKAQIVELAKTSVSRQEMDWRAQRGIEDRTRTEAAVAELRTGTVSRAEWTERNRARDQEVTDLNRRVDELRQDVGSVYGTRDVIQDMKKEIETLRSRLATMRNTPP